jgi:hypothetical protein
MAFGADDTDHIYDGAIVPVLRSEGVAPVRVDRREHNRNINDVIMEELKRSDFVVADLTYARPSVYFEAGFGERAGAVIYTVRADHLKGTGDMRVHFDVSMRNIIAWNSATDAKFAPRLRRRVRHVLKPLRAERKQVEERRVREAAFAALPSRKQVELLQHAATAFLRSRDLAEEKATRSLASTFHVRSGKVLRSICVLVLEKWIRGTVMTNYLASSMVLPSLATHQKGVKSVEYHLVLATTQAVAFSKIRNAFPDAYADVRAKTVSFLRETTGFDLQGSARSRPQTKLAETTFVHLIDSVRSEESLLGRLAEIVPGSERAV